jgi:hypothetical protein
MTKRQKIGLAALLSVAGVSVLTGGIYYTWLITPPGPPKTAEEGVKTIGSARFARLPDYRKSAYMEQTRDLVMRLPQDQQREIVRQFHDNEAVHRQMEQGFRAAMTKQVMDFAKASPEDRLKLLDAAIDREEQMRSMWGGGRGPGGPPGGGGFGRPGQGGPGAQGQAPGRGGPGGPGHGNWQARMQQMVEHGNPQQFALMRQFRQAVEMRRAQRGLSPSPWRGRGH